MLKLFLIINLVISPVSTRANEREQSLSCDPLLVGRKIIPNQMYSFWGTLDLREQQMVVGTVARFVEMSISGSKSNLDDSLQTFSVTMENMLTGIFMIRPNGSDLLWLETFLLELKGHSRTESKIKEKLTEILSSISPYLNI